MQENRQAMMEHRRQSPLDERQETFCTEFIANGGNATQAAKVAGYSLQSARKIASMLLRRPDISKRIRELQRQFVDTELGQSALDTVSELMRNPKTPPAVRLGAARTALAAAGLDKPTEAKLLEEKDISDMDLSELNEFIKAGAKRLQALRNPIEGVKVDRDIIDVYVK